VRIGIACDGGPPAAELLDLLEAAGLPAASLRDERPPALLPAAGGVWLLATGSDVLGACDRGGLDLGVVGRDRLLEGRRGATDLLDLRCCRDDLVFAVAPIPDRPGRRLRVATRHPETARRHFAATGVQPEILAMDEPALAPALGVADGVVELASRLAAPRTVAPALEVRAVVAACSARLVAARAARVLRRGDIDAFVRRLRSALED
jgi:ATP phosphoribosyltransferase